MAEKKCPECDGTGEKENYGGCSDVECCGYPFYICYECNGEGTINEEEEAS